MSETRIQTDSETQPMLWLKYAPSVVLFLALVLVISYAIVFHKLPATENPGAWGSFGDYIGGLLNPIVAFCTLLVAVAVWQLQSHELQATKEVLKQQVNLSTLANIREQQIKEEQLYLAVLDKLSKTASNVTGGQYGSGMPYLDELADRIWNYQLGQERPSFANAFATRLQVTVDETIERFQPRIDSYLRMTALALQILQDRLSDRKLFSEIFCAQIGQPQLSLLCYASCSTKNSDLKALIQNLNLHRRLPSIQYRQLVEYGWFQTAEE